MRKSLCLLFGLLFAINVHAQEFSNGKIYVKVTNAGSTLFGSPDQQTLQITRISTLISGNQYQVFDYLNDADSTDISAYSLTTPIFGDYQVQSVFDNSFSFDPPAYKVELNTHGWFDDAYAISHYKVTNIDSNTYNSKFGFEILPYIDNIYGNEKIEYYSEGEYIRISRDTLSAYVGIKLLSSPITSLYIEDWVSGYNKSDTTLYNNLFYESIIDTFTASDSGSVIIPSIASQTVSPQESYDVYLALAVGNSFVQLDSNMTNAQLRYNTIITTSVETEEVPLSVELYQNYPNPFNPSTNIKFSLPQKEFVELSVYNVIGQRVEKLITQEMPIGKHEVQFKSGNLSSGIYFYTLKAGNFIVTKKMILLK